MSVLVTVLMIPIGYVRCGLQGKPPPTFTADDMLTYLMFAAAMFVVFLALWPAWRGLPLPFEKAPPQETSSDDRAGGRPN